MNIFNKLGLKKIIEATDEDSISINTTNTKNNNTNVIKLIIILFLLYIIISSNIVTNGIFSRFNKKSESGVTCIGRIVQGILLVCFYMFFAYLVNKNII